MADVPTLSIRGGQALLPDGELHPVDLLAEGGRIAETGPRLEAKVEIDARGGIVLPGLIDLHTHGIGRVSTEVGALAEYARLEAERGTTTFYPTLFGPPQESAAHMRRHRRETGELARAPQVGGFRLESPYLAQTGAGVRRDLAAIDPALTGMLLEAGGGHVRIWDVSPELEGAPELIRQLSARGIVCSLAHTQATIEQARAAVDAGARLVTHLFDTFIVPQITDPGVYPAGLVDYLLVEDRLTCEIVSDGTHVHPILVEKALRCKPEAGIACVTDSNFGAGLPPGRYTLPASWGEVQIDGPNNGVRQVDRDMGLAGSALTPIDGFRNMIRLFGQDLLAASRVWSANPARLMGLNKGRISPGLDADLIVLDKGLELCYTVLGGQVIYRA